MGPRFFLEPGVLFFMEDSDGKPAQPGAAAPRPPEKPWSRGLLYAWAATAYAGIALVGGLLLYFFYVLLFG